MVGKFEIFKDKAGKFRFRLVASNGEIIAACDEGFESRGTCESTIELVRNCVSEAKIRDFTARACPKCGVLIRADSNFCDHCDARLDWQPK
jgi:uncharacterized protein YegP (UPF0339 family)